MATRRQGSGQYSHLHYCGQFVGPSLVFSDGYCGPDDGPQCPECVRFQTTVPVRRSLGSGNGANRYYCGQYFGRALQGSDGRCGPSNGPQCPGCRVFQANKSRESAGQRSLGSGQYSHLHYCGQFVGPSLVFSDGYCGPDDGPQCPECVRFQTTVPVRRSLGSGNGANRYYCGQYFGRALQGSDGRCGPSNGPQCPGCLAYQATIDRSQQPPSSQAISTVRQTPHGGAPSEAPTAHQEPSGAAPMANDLPTERACVVCLDKPPSCVLIPCGHLVLCMECGGTQSITLCPICRAGIGQRIRVFSV